MQDLIYLCFISGDGSALTIQTYVHHIVAIMTFYETAFFMDFMMIFGCMLLFVEFSTVFLSARTLFFFHGMQNTLIYNINGILTFVTFFLARVVYMNGITIFLGIPSVYDKISNKNMSTLEVAVVIQLIVLVIGSIALNMHWFMLMLNTMKRAFKRLMGGEDAGDDLE